MYDEMIIDHVDLKYDCKILKTDNEKVSVEIKLIKTLLLNVLYLPHYLSNKRRIANDST